MIDEANMDMLLYLTAIIPCKTLCQHKQQVTWKHVLQGAWNHRLLRCGKNAAGHQAPVTEAASVTWQQEAGSSRKQEAAAGS